MISEEDKQRYIKHPYSCMYCKMKDSIQISDRWADFDFISQKITCYACWKSWREIYQLTDVEEEEDVL